jgi:hypothetical protein
MPRLPVRLGLLIAPGLFLLCGLAQAGSDMAGSDWTVVVSEDCQLGQIGKISLKDDGSAQATAVVESASGNGASTADTETTDLQGTWTYTDNILHLSFNDGSLTLDGPVKEGRFIAKAVMKTDLGDPMNQDCTLKRD